MSIYLYENAKSWTTVIDRIEIPKDLNSGEQGASQAICIQTAKDAKCSPESKSFGILILSITADP